MKLKLESVRDISILQVTGSVTPDNFAILRAGIKKLLSSGKNKIILELLDSGTFPTPVLRDLAILNLMASELSGQIVLAQIAPLTRAKIEAFSKPPVVTCYPDRNSAIASFHPPVTEEIPSKSPTPAPVAPAPTTPTPAPAPVAATPAPVAPASVAPTPTPAVAAPLPTEEQQKEFKKDIRARELGDIGEVRKKLSELEVENKELKTRLAELMVVRRDPPDLESWKEKTAKLEKDLAEAIKVAQDMAATMKK